MPSTPTTPTFTTDDPEMADMLAQLEALAATGDQDAAEALTMMAAIAATGFAKAAAIIEPEDAPAVAVFLAALDDGRLTTDRIRNAATMGADMSFDLGEGLVLAVEGTDLVVRRHGREVARESQAMMRTIAVQWAAMVLLADES